MRDAATRLLGQGFSLNVGPIAGQSTQGTVTGSLTLELAPAHEGRLSLAEQLRSRGELRISGAVLTEDQLEMLQGMELVTFEGQALRAAYSYAGGVLTVNGAPREAQGLQAYLTEFDAVLAGVLAAPSAKPRRRRRPFLQPRRPCLRATTIPSWPWPPHPVAAQWASFA